MTLPFYMPDQTDEDYSYPQQSRTSDLSGAGSILDLAQVNSTANANYLGEMQSEISQDNPGKKLDPDQVPSEWRHEFPKGTNSNVLSIYQAAKENQIRLSDQINNMPSTGYTDLTKFGAGMIGSALTPTGLLASTIAPELGGAIGSAGKAVLSSSRVANAGIGVAQGAVEAGAFGAATSNSEYNFENSVGENPDPMMIIHSAISNAAMFGPIRGFFGAFTPIRSEDHNAIVDTAIQQTQAGKDINVGPVIKQAIYENTQRAIKNGILNEDEINNYSNSLQDQLDQHDEALQSLENTPNIPLSGLSRLNDAIETLQKNDEEGASTAANARLMGYQDLNYMKNIIDMGAKNPLELTSSENDFLNSFIENPSIEKDLIQSSIDTLKKKFPDNPDLLEPYQKRMNDVNQLSLVDKESMDASDNVNRLKISRQGVQHMKDIHDATLKMIQESAPITKVEAQNSSNQINSSDAYSYSEISSKVPEAQNINKSKMQLDDVKKTAQEYVADNRIRPDDLKQLDEETQNQEKNMSIARRKMNDMVDCLTGDADG